MRKAATRSARKCCRWTRSSRTAAKYPERLKEALENTGETDALIVMGGAVASISVVAACFEFDFMGGSMGSVVGERFVRGCRIGDRAKVPFICFTATGGAHAGRPAQPDADGQDQRRPHAGWPRRASPTSAC